MRLPSLQNGTVFECHYDDDGATAQPACQTDGSVWQGAYAGVWHFSEADGTAADSGPHGLDAVPKGQVAESIAVEGVLGTGRQSSSGAEGYLSIPSYDQLKLGGRFTISAWVRANGASGYMRIFSRKRSWTEGSGWEIEMTDGSTVKFSARGAGSVNLAGTFATSLLDGWKHLALVYDDATLRP